jgi:hypothetical protein
MNTKHIKTVCMAVIEADNAGHSYADPECIDKVHALADEAAAIHTLAEDHDELLAVLKRMTYFVAEVRAGNAFSESVLWDEIQRAQRVIRRVEG